MKKQLLNESEIRRMMKFANIGTLTNDHLARLDEAAETTPLEEDEGEELDEGMGMHQAKEELDEGAHDEEEAPDAAELDEPMDEPMMDEPEEDAGEMELSQEEAEVLIALGQRLSGEMGDEELDAEPEMDMDMDMGMPDEAEEELEEELVNEVLSRVARRLKTLK